MNGEDQTGDAGRPAEMPELFDYPSATHKRRDEGTVMAVREDTAQVLIRRSRMCEGCGSCCVMVDAETMLAEAENRAGAKEGDRVVVDLPPSLSIRAAYILYGIPLLAFFAGIAAGALLGHFLFDWGFNVPLALLFGVLFLALSYIVISRVYAPGTRSSSKYRLVITRILE